LTTRGGEPVFAKVPIKDALAVLKLSGYEAQVYLCIAALRCSDMSMGWGGSLRQLRYALSEACGKVKNATAVSGAVEELEAVGTIWTRRRGQGLSIGLGTPPTPGVVKETHHTRESDSSDTEGEPPEISPPAGGEAPSPLPVKDTHHTREQENVPAIGRAYLPARGDLPEIASGRQVEGGQGDHAGEDTDGEVKPKREVRI